MNSLTRSLYLASLLSAALIAENAMAAPVPLAKSYNCYCKAEWTPDAPGSSTGECFGNCTDKDDDYLNGAVYGWGFQEYMKTLDECKQMIKNHSDSLLPINTYSCLVYPVTIQPPVTNGADDTIIKINNTLVPN